MLRIRCSARVWDFFFFFLSCHSNFMTEGGRIRSPTLSNHPNGNIHIPPLHLSISLRCDTTWLSSFAKLLAFAPLHTRTHTHLVHVSDGCVRRKLKTMHDRLSEGGLYSNPASLFLYLNHWPVVVVSHLCCVQGEWADLILDCSPVMEAGGGGGTTWHLKNSGGHREAGKVHRKTHFVASGPCFHTLSLFNTDRRHTSAAPCRANMNISQSCLTFICISATYALNSFVSI